MIPFTFSPVLLLLILMSSVVISVSYEFNTLLPKDVDIGAKSASAQVSGEGASTGRAVSGNDTTAVDKFGIREIYPTAIGGKEWYINMSSPLSDKNFSLSGGSEKSGNATLTNATASNGQIIRQPDGSYELYGVRKTGKYDFSVRMNVNTSESSQFKWWKNVEMTGYIKVINATSNNAAIDWYARGRLHISSSPCQGVAYHGGLRTEGSVFWQKEIWHTGGYTDYRGDVNVTHPILGRWVGFKVIMFNINNDSAVQLQTYLDDGASNHWKKVEDIVDNGGWYAIAPDDLFYSANCGRSKDHVILNAGPIATFRSDNMIWDFKDLSIREIQAPSGAKSSTVKQLTTNSSSASYNPYIFGNATQEWIDKEHNVRIMFTPSPEYPYVGNLTQLGFKIWNLKTGSLIKNVNSTITVINNSAANPQASVSNRGTSNGEFSIFRNIAAPDGSFSVKYHFTQPGTHQIIARINSKENTFSALASFNVIVLPS
jgi:hypothetical protein